MKARLENIPVENRGVELESETPGEADVLLEIWNTQGGPAALTHKESGTVELVIAPQPGGDRQELLNQISGKILGFCQGKYPNVEAAAEDVLRSCR